MEERAMKRILNLIFLAIAIGMAIAVVVLSILNTLLPTTAVLLLGIGLAALAISHLSSLDLPAGG
jgi:hypothetical protein